MNAIFERRSIRKYTSQAISDDNITKLLEAAMAAPSAANKQPWHFIVVKDRNKLNEIMDAHPYSKMLSEAPIAIVVCGDSSLELYPDYWIQDCSAATQNILIMAQSLGLGSVWLGVHPREERSTPIKKIFKLPENVNPLCIIAIGYSDEIKGPSNRFNPDRVHINEW